MFNGGLDKIRQYVLLKYNGKYTITMVPDTKSDYLSNTDKIKLWAQRKTNGRCPYDHFNIIDSFWYYLPVWIN
jgi:hypothetical protein